MQSAVPDHRQGVKKYEPVQGTATPHDLGESVQNAARTSVLTHKRHRAILNLSWRFKVAALTLVAGLIAISLLIQG